MENEDAIRRIETSMPKLNLETALRSKRLLGHLLQVHGPPTPRGKQMSDGYVRLVEKTVLEYQASREKLIAFMKHGFADDYFRAQDHFESGVQSLHRAILYFDHLRRYGFRQQDGSPFVPRPRDLEVLRSAVKDRVRLIRDLIEHLDKDILDKKIPEDAEVAIHLGWEKASLGGEEIKYTEYVRWVEQLHNFAGLLSRVRIIVNDSLD